MQTQKVANAIYEHLDGQVQIIETLSTVASAFWLGTRAAVGPSTPSPNLAIAMYGEDPRERAGSFQSKQTNDHFYDSEVRASRDDAQFLVDLGTQIYNARSSDHNSTMNRLRTLVRHFVRLDSCSPSCGEDYSILVEDLLDHFAKNQMKVYDEMETQESGGVLLYRATELIYAACMVELTSALKD